MPQYETRSKNLGAGSSFQYRFVGSNWTNTDQQQGVQTATPLWSAANARTQLNTSFAMAADESSAQIN
jgi:hypothetical protein